MLSSFLLSSVDPPMAAISEYSISNVSNAVNCASTLLAKSSKIGS
jgi:hypothetical protein